MSNDRINDMSMTPIDMCIALSGGLPGALVVTGGILKEGPVIDPDAMHHMLTLLHLDTMRIYDSDIWVLFKDCCGQNMTNFLAVLRACQLGLLSEHVVKDAIAKQHTPLDCPAIVAMVQEQLPAFGRAVPVT